MIIENKKTILLVDDEPLIALSEKSSLEEYGYNVIIAYTSEEAIELFKENKDIELILMDIDLGKGINGADTAIVLLKEREIPVIFLSGHTEPEIVEKTEKISSYGYVDKNSGITVLDATIKMAFKLFNANQKIAESESRYRNIYDNAMEGMYQVSLNGKVQLCNHAVAKMLGYDTPDDLVNKVTDSARQHWLNPDERVHFISLLEKQETVLGFECQFIHLDGGIIWVSLNAKLVRDENGNKLFYHGFIEDITRRKQAEEKLRESEDKFRLLHENSGIGITYCKPDGTVLSYNHIAAEHMYVLPEDFIGKSIYDIFPEKKAMFYHNRIKKSLLSDNPFIYEDIINLPSGDKYLLSVYTKIAGVMDNMEKVQIISLDITEYKEAEIALHETEAKYRSYVENAPDGVFVTDEKGHFLEVNNAACSITGFTREELLQMSFIDLLRDESIENGLAHLRILSEAGETKGDFQFRRKDGSKRWGSVDAVKINESHYLVFANDITERKHAEIALQDSEEKYRLLVENSHDIIYTLTKDGIFSFVSPSLTYRLGYPVEQAVGQSFQRFVHPDDIQNCIMRIQKAIETGKSWGGIEYRIRHIDGNWHWYNTNAVILKDDSGMVVGFECIARDITERRQLEEALRESEEKFRFIVDNSMMPMIIASLKDYTVIFYNIFASEFFSDTSPAGTIKAQDYWVRPSERDIFIGKLKEKGTVKEYEAELRTARGEHKWCLLSAKIINYLGQPASFVMFNDITELKLAEDRIKTLLTEKELIIEGKEKLLIELQEAMSQITTLSGLLPICAACKKIRNDDGYWEQIEGYIMKHSQVDFTHGICPDCANKMYGKYLNKKNI